MRSTYIINTVLVVLLMLVIPFPGHSQITDPAKKKKSHAGKKGINKIASVPISPVLQFAVDKKPAAAFISPNGQNAIDAVLGAGTLYVIDITDDGRLSLRSGAEKGSVFYPAELGGYRDIRFTGNPCVTIRWGNQLEIAAISTDGRLLKISQNDGSWHVYFVAEAAGQPYLKCKGNPSLTVYNKGSFGGQVMSFITLTEDDRLVEFKFEGLDNKWSVNYPAELAGRSEERFIKSVAQTQNGLLSQDVVAVTKTGKLLHLWNEATGNAWHGEFPAELAGMESSVRFLDGATIIKHILWGGQTIAAITADNKLVTLNYRSKWASAYPCEAAGQPGLRFLGNPSLITSYENTFGIQMSVFVLNKDKKLVQVFYDRDRKWGVDYPTVIAGQPDLTFKESPAAIFLHSKIVVSKTTDNRYSNVCVRNARWNIEYAFE